MNPNVNFDKSLLPTAIEKVEDLDAVLTTVYLSSKGWLRDVIDAQRQLVHSVENPYVFDASVDTVVSSMHKALSHAKDETEVEEIREAFSGVIQSMMTYLDAYTRVYLDDIRSVGKKCFRSAALVLSNSIQATALFCVSLATSARLQVEEDDEKTTVGLGFGFDQNDVVRLFRNNTYAANAELSFVELASGVYDWFHKKKREEKLIAQYAKSVSSVVEKLCKYKKIFGGNIIIAGVMQRSLAFMEAYIEEGKTKKQQLVKSKYASRYNDKRIALFFLLLLGIIVAIAGIVQMSYGHWLGGLLCFIPLGFYIYRRRAIKKNFDLNLDMGLDELTKEYLPEYEKLQFYREEAKYFDNIWQPE